MMIVRAVKILTLILVLLFLPGCDNSGIDEKEKIPEGWKSLDEIAGNPAYTTLQLTGIRWELIGFADEGKNIIRPVVPTVLYIAYFRIDNTIGGQIYINKLHGEYSSLGEGNIQMDVDIIEHVTEYGMEDADSFIEALNASHTFTVTEKGLQLYYGEDQHYLLFKCAVDNRCLQAVSCGEEDYTDKVCTDESISGTWKAHKIRLNISGALCEVIPPSNGTLYPDISIEIHNTTNGYEFNGNTFFNWITGVTIEILGEQHIIIKGGLASRNGEDDWGISFMENTFEETVAYCFSDNELIFLNSEDLPIIVFIKN